MMWLFTALLLSAISVKAETWDYYLVNNSEAVITKYNGPESEITIPNSLNGYPVTKLEGRGFAAGIFADQSNPSPATKINIPSGVREIGDWALYHCVNLTNLTIPGTVTNIGYNAFHRLHALREVVIPESVSRMDFGAFTWCIGLTNVVIPASLSSIPDFAFAACTSLRTIIIPSTVTNMGAGVFYECSQLDSVYFLGNAPTTSETWNGANDNHACPATVYVMPDDTSWNSTFAGRPVVKLSGTQVFNLGKQSVLVTPNLNYLYTESQYSNNYSVGQQSILNSPNSHGLYTTNQIHNLGLGGIMVNRNTNNHLVLNYQVLQSEDLQNWSPYQQYELPITNAPSDKMFLRVQAVGQ